MAGDFLCHPEQAAGARSDPFLFLRVRPFCLLLVCFWDIMKEIISKEKAYEEDHQLYH